MIWFIEKIRLTFWAIRKYLIKKLAGRQTVVLNTTIDYVGKGIAKKNLHLLVKGHHKMFIMENITIQSFDGDPIEY